MAIHHATLSRAHRQGLHIEEEHDGHSVYRAKIVDRSDREKGSKDVELLTTAPLIHTKGGAKHALSEAEAMVAEEGAPDEVNLSSDTDDDEEIPGSIVASKYKERYVDGNNGDEIATEASAFMKVDGKFNLDRYQEVCKANDIDNSGWDDLNNGQKSMNCRNRLRAKWRSGEDVHIGEHTVPGKEQDEEDGDED